MKRIIKIVWIVYALLSVITYLLSCTAPLVHPRHSSAVYFCGLAFPFIFANYCLVTIYLGFVKKKYIFLLFLIPGLLYALNFVSLGKFSDNQPEVISVFTINAHSANLLHDDERKYQAWIRHVEVDSNMPDIVCFQELAQSAAVFIPKLKNYHTHSYQKSNLKIASQFPMISSGEIKDGEGLRFAIFVDIVMKKDTIRIYSFHLYSNKISPLLTDENHPISEHLFVEGEQVSKKIFSSATKRAEEAQLLSWHIKASPHPVIVCGDMNETAQSYAYRQIKGGLNDTFKKGVFGIHPTYRQNPSWVRIDYIFTDPRFGIVNYEVLPFAISDHRVVSTLLVQK